MTESSAAEIKAFWFPTRNPDTESKEILIQSPPLHHCTVDTLLEWYTLHLSTTLNEKPRYNVMINPQTKTFKVSTLRFWMLQRHSTNIGLCEHSWYSDCDATSVTLHIQIRGGTDQGFDSFTKLWTAYWIWNCVLYLIILSSKIWWHFSTKSNICKAGSRVYLYSLDYCNRHV